MVQYNGWQMGKIVGHGFFLLQVFLRQATTFKQDLALPSSIGISKLIDNSTLARVQEAPGKPSLKEELKLRLTKCYMIALLRR